MGKLDNENDSLETESVQDTFDLPELHKKSFFEIVWDGIVSHYEPSKGEALPLGDRLKRIGQGTFKLLGFMIVWPFRAAAQGVSDVKDWFEGTVEIQRAIARHRKRRKERMKAMTKLHAKQIISLLEDDRNSYNEIKAKLKGKQLFYWWYVTVRWQIISFFDIFVPGKKEKKRLAKQMAGATLEKQVKQKPDYVDEEPRGLKGLSKKINDFWANKQRSDKVGLFVKHKDSKLRLSASQWTKLESVYRRAHLLMKQGNFDEAVVAFEACVDMLGKSTGDSIYSGLGHAKFGVLQRDAPNKSLEWIEQWCNDTSFCFQQANWVNSANKSYLRKASEAKQLADGWADKFRDLVADVDRLNFELSMVEKSAPNHPSVIEAKRELYSAKVTLNVFGFNEAEAIVKKAAVMVSTVTDKGFLA